MDALPFLQFFWLHLHSVIRSHNLEIHLNLWKTLHSMGCSKLVFKLRISRKRVNILPAGCLGKYMIQSWRQQRLKKELGSFTLCAYCTDTAECHPKIWLILVMYCLHFECLFFCFFLPRPPTYCPPLSLWKWFNSSCKQATNATLLHNIIQQIAWEHFSPDLLTMTVCQLCCNTKQITC